MGVHHGWLSLVAVTSGQMVRNGAVFQPTFTELSWRSLDGSIAHLSDPTIGCTLSSSWGPVVKLSALRTVVKRGTFPRLTGDGSRGAAVTGVGCAAAWNGSVRVGGQETLDTFIDIARLGQSTLGEVVRQLGFRQTLITLTQLL